MDFKELNDVVYDMTRKLYGPCLATITEHLKNIDQESIVRENFLLHKNQVKDLMEEQMALDKDFEFHFTALFGVAYFRIINARNPPKPEDAKQPPAPPPSNFVAIGDRFFFY